MGGFAGGDEGGYWDIDTVSTLVNKTSKQQLANKNKKKSYIETIDSGYSIQTYSHSGEINGTVSFVDCKCKTLTIESDDNVAFDRDTFHKAYRALIDLTDDLDIVDFFNVHKIVVSNDLSTLVSREGDSFVAAFILLTKEACNLVLNSDELSNIGSMAGVNISFYIHNYQSTTY